MNSRRVLFSNIVSTYSNNFQHKGLAPYMGTLNDKDPNNKSTNNNHQNSNNKSTKKIEIHRNTYWAPLGHLQWSSMQRGTLHWHRNKRSSKLGTKLNDSSGRKRGAAERRPLILTKNPRLRCDLPGNGESLSWFCFFGGCFCPIGLAATGKFLSSCLCRYLLDSS